MFSKKKPNNTNVIGQMKQQEVIYTWSIDDFCDIRKQYPTGKFISSPVFPTDVESQWQIELYPQGHEDDEKEYISIYIVNRSGATIEAQITYFVMDGVQALHRSEAGYDKYESHDGLGYPRYLHYNDVFAKLLANNNNKLIIKCKIELDNISCIESPENFRLSKYDHFEKLLNSSKFSDVILTAGGEKIHAHKNILTINCEVFAAMFQHDMAEREQNVIEIKDISANVLKEMLRYLYVGKVNNIVEIASDLLVAADKYLLECLKNMCEESLCDNLSSSNVIEYLKLAENHNAFRLKNEAIQYIVTNAEKIIDEPEFQLYENLDSKLIYEIFHKLVKQRADEQTK